MFTLLRKMAQSASLGRCVHNKSYEEAIRILQHDVQSNAAYLQSVQNHTANDSQKLRDTEKYLLRSGLTLEQLDTLSVIHVAGTKGKGTTCALTEVILREHGYSTGFFSSPHLVSIRERIRINGNPISQSHFAHTFWNIYTRLKQKQEHETDMPTYFKFLTILMFHVFLEAKIDVAIIEVGIGGELDCTNIIRNPVCVGITNLGLDHTSLLGNTLEQIAYQKSGIIKKNAAVFTAIQPESVLAILEARAKERNSCCFNIIPPFTTYDWYKFFLPKGIDTLHRQNASLATWMAIKWMKFQRYKETSRIINGKCSDSPHDYRENLTDFHKIVHSSQFSKALDEFKWPGRTQILHTKIAHFFLDGAHTVESIHRCISWFEKASSELSELFLVFNVTGNRNAAALLTPLRSVAFSRAYFIPNNIGVPNAENWMNYELMKEQKNNCITYSNLWGENAVTRNSVIEVLYDIKQYNLNIKKHKVGVLVTGSLHLVGAMLTILDPNLTMTSEYDDKS